MLDGIDYVNVIQITVVATLKLGIPRKQPLEKPEVLLKRNNLFLDYSFPSGLTSSSDSNPSVDLASSIMHSW